MLDPTHLRYFLAIAAHGSITAAARALHASQPTLTVALRNLEEHLGTTLVLRERTGVTLTHTGEELVHHAREIFEAMRRAEEGVRGIEKDDVGEFTLGCHESLGAYFLPDFMAGFLRENPGVEIRLANDTSRGTADAVLARKVDFGIVVNPQPHPDLTLVEMFHDAMDVMIASEALPASRRGRTSHEPEGRDPGLTRAHDRLRAGPVIFAGRISESRELLELLERERVIPGRRLVCGDLELVKSLALAGIGPAILPRRVARYGHEGRLVRLHERLPYIRDTICLVYRADRHRTRAAMRLKDALVGYGKQLDAAGR